MSSCRLLAAKASGCMPRHVRHDGLIKRVEGPDASETLWAADLLAGGLLCAMHGRVRGPGT